MSRTDSILEFIDGTLDFDREQMLFEDFATHPELRAELRQHIAIGEAVRADREAYVPPADVERTLLAGLGIAPMVGAGTATTVMTGAGTVARIGFLKGVVPVAMSFVLGALLAGAGVFWSIDPDSGALTVASDRDTIYLPQSIVVPSVTETTSVAAVAEDPGAATLMSSHASSATATSRTRASAAEVDARALRIADAPMTLATADAPPEAVVSSLPLETVELRANDAEPDGPSTASTSELDVRGSLMPIDPFELGTVDDADEIGFVSVRKQLFMKPIFDNNAREVEGSLTDEAAIGAYLRTGTHSAWGLELGRGRYTQVLTTPEGFTVNGVALDRSITRIEQAPNVTWIGLGYRQTIGSPTALVQPWVVLAGAYGLENGPMVNARLGVSLDMLADVSVTTALEGSTLVYMFNGQPLVSAKYGLTFGLQYGF